MPYFCSIARLMFFFVLVAPDLADVRVSAPGFSSQATSSSGFTSSDELFERSPVVIVVSPGVGNNVNVTPAATAGGGQTAAPTNTTASSSSGGGSGANADQSTTGSLLLTAKHLQTAHAVLFAAQSHGNYLNGSWSIMLTTLQVNCLFLSSFGLVSTNECGNWSYQDVPVRIGTPIGCSVGREVVTTWGS